MSNIQPIGQIWPTELGHLIVTGDLPMAAAKVLGETHDAGTPVLGFFPKCCWGSSATALAWVLGSQVHKSNSAAAPAELQLLPTVAAKGLGESSIVGASAAQQGETEHHGLFPGKHGLFPRGCDVRLLPAGSQTSQSRC